ncbi:MAG: S41 family peptidase [Candidatus Limivicinus sp.]
MKKNSLFGRFFAALGRALSRIFNSGIPLKFVLIALILFTGGAIFITRSSVIKNVGGKADYDEAMRYIEIKDIVEENYIDPVNRESMGYSAAAAMVAGLGDKWSTYMSPDEYKAYQLSASNEYSGIGMSIMKEANTGGFQITSINSGSPAHLGGLSSGMIIVAVDGEDVTGLDADSFRTLVRSKQNTKFTVETSNGETYDVNCAATYVNPVSYRLEKTEAGYVKIDNFEAGSGQAAIDAFEDLLNQNASAFVIDLRGNPGGLTSELQTFLDYLLPSGDLFVAVDKSGKEEVYASDSVCLDMPMCVLVNSETYSEAEIFAAVLQEYDWATIMGEPTTGKTRTQQIIEISDGSAIRLSTHSFLTPNRVDISLNGVIPDSIVYNSDPSTVGTTEGTTGGSSGTASSSNDEQLIAALKLLSQTSF